MNENRAPQKSVEIDIKEMIVKLLMQWKMMLVFALLIAVLLCGMKYAKDIRAFDAEMASYNQLIEQSSRAEEERIAEVMDTLSEKDKSTVSFVVSEKENVNLLREYINNSVLMKTDPTNQKVLKKVYGITGDISNITFLVNDYSSFIYSDEITEKIKPLIGEEVENEYVTELFYTSEDTKTTDSINNEEDLHGNNAVVRVNLALPEDADADGISKALDEAFYEHASSLKERYAHSITVVSAETAHLYHKNNADRKNDVFNRVNGLENNIRNMENYLTPEQKAAISSIEAIKASYNDADDESEAEGIEKPVKPIMDKKYLVLGFGLGVFLYIFVYAFILILRNRINSADSLEKYTNARLLGAIASDGGTNRTRILTRSKLMEKLLSRNDKNGRDHIEEITETISAICSHLGKNDIALFDTREGVKDSNGYLDKLISVAGDKGVRIRLLDAAAQVEESELLSISDAVILADADTRVQILEKLLILFREYDIRLLGNLYVR